MTFSCLSSNRKYKFLESWQVKVNLSSLTLFWRPPTTWQTIHFWLIYLLTVYSDMLLNCVIILNNNSNWLHQILPDKMLRLRHKLRPQGFPFSTMEFWEIFSGFTLLLFFDLSGFNGCRNNNMLPMMKTVLTKSLKI